MDINLEPRGVFHPAGVFPLKDPRIRKQCDLRFPTDDEWRARHRRIFDVTVPAGFDASKQEVVGEEEASAELFGKIRADEGGEPFDEAEATRMIDSLMRCDCLETHWLGQEFVCRLLHLGGVETVHRLRMPSERQARQFNKDFVYTLIKRGGRRETYTNIAAAERLYDDLQISASEYADGAGTPLEHKLRAAVRLMNALEEFEAGDPLLTASSTPKSPKPRSSSRRAS